MSDHGQNPSQRPFLTDKLALALAAVILLGMGVLAGGAALRESIAVDEIAHVGAGVSYLQTLDMRMNVEHPPLAKLLAGLPLVLRGAHADYQSTAWTAGDGLLSAFMAEWSFGHALATRWNEPFATMVWARFPMLLLTLALGALLYVYGSRLADARGGLLCVCLYASTPAILTFGPLVLTDVAIAFFTLLTLWTFVGLWQSDADWRTTARFALALAGALLSKFSAGLVFFAFVAFSMSLRWWPVLGVPADRAEARAWRRRASRRTWTGVLGAALVVYAVYFVLSWNQPTDSLEFLGGSPVLLIVRRLLMPPWIYLRGLALFAVTASRPTFILGQAYSHGVWFYFPVLFLLKTPLASLVLFLLAVPAAALAKRFARVTATPPGRELHRRAVWTFFAITTAACMLGRMDLSIRHFITPIVLLILLAAPLPVVLASLAGSVRRVARALGWATAALALASLVTVVRAYPYYMPFFNVLGLGRPGYLLANDSNLDWSQALPEVRRFVEERGLASVLLDQYGFSEVTVYVPQARWWNCQEPAPADAGAWAVVSAAMILDGHNCRWLLQYPNETLAGGGMHAFRLPLAIPAPGAPGGPPRPQDFRNFAGMPGGQDPRLVILACIRDPGQIAPTIERMMQEYKAQAK